MADQTPETPEALACIDATPHTHPKAESELFALQLLTESWIDPTGQHDQAVMARLIRTRDAALIAKHTAELTARLHVTGVRCEEAEAELARWKLHAENQERRVETLQAELTARIRELEAANLELGLELKRGELGVTTVALMASKERIADLKAQLAASAQREASARAEALRELDLELVKRIDLMEAKESHQPAGDPDSVAYSAAIVGLESARRLVADLLASPPPPRVDAWIPVSERRPDVLEVVYIYPYLDGALGAYCDAHGNWWADSESEEAIFHVTHWQPLPPPPAHQPAAGTEGSTCDGCDSPPMKGDTICADCETVMHEADDEDEAALTGTKP